MKVTTALFVMTIMVFLSVAVTNSTSDGISESALFTVIESADEDGKVALTPVQIVVNKLMRMWTLLDTIHAVQSVSWEHMTLFAREVVEETLKVYVMIDLLTKDPEVVSDTETMLYLSDLVGKIDTVQVGVFAHGTLDDIVCLRVIMRVLQKKLLLARAYQQ